jgi:mono/diheme cytochrome c family protein
MPKIVKLALLAVAAMLGGLGLFLLTFKPRTRPPATEVIERTPARLERGNYLVNHVLGCMDCHARRDFTRFGGPIVGPPGGGNGCFGPEYGLPGKICPTNITPDNDTGLGAWSDGEIMRAVREGVDREGKALFMMPYLEYRSLSEEDVRAVVVSLRALPPVKSAQPDTTVDFPVSFFIKFGPKPLFAPVPEPDRSNQVAYGQYLAKVGVCQFCHTPIDGRHLPVPGKEFAGGHEFKGPWGVVRSSNLSPHEAGMGARDDKAFVALFKAFAGPEADLPSVAPEANTVMPWLSRAQMTESDLAAIHAYLKTVPAQSQPVEKRPRPVMPAHATEGAADAGAGKADR